MAASLHKRRLRFEPLERRALLTTFYVDGVGGDGPGGNDLNDGQSLNSAFATIQRASTFAFAGDTILVRGGVYREQVDALRSGNEANPITYAPYNGEDVAISGGDLVSGWTQFNGDVWVATAAWNANDNRDANTLLVDGQTMSEGRQFGETDLLDIDDWGLLKKGRLQNNANSFTVDDLQGFANDFFNGAKVKFHTHDWVLETRTIADFNASTGRITLDSPIGLVSQKQDNGYYIYDSLQTVDQPGEWYKQDGGDQLYYHVAPGQNPNDLEIEFKRRAFAFDVSGKDYIHIKDFEFRGVSIGTDADSDNNVFEGNRFYAYDKGGFGRFFISGDNNVLRDNELSHTWSSFVTVDGVRNAIVNNYIHDIGYGGTTRAISAAGAEELLVSHNTVSTFARSFMDGYPTRSEIAHNVFEDGGNITWDTGVFDADGGNGDSSYSIFHHNVFRNTETRGIFEAFYGRNNNAVVHHNLFHDFNESANRTVFRSYGLDFRQSYHNTIISNASAAPSGELDALDAIQARYNNNVQISTDRMEALGVDVRGNHNYAPSDFVDFNNNDFRLAAGSDAIDSGIELPGVNDGYLGAAPDAGAFESGQPAWQAGHNFVAEPNPVYAWQALPGTNLYLNGQFRAGIGDWAVVAGTPHSQDRNSWNLSASGASLTGTFRTESVELTPGEGIRRTFTGLTPGSTYTVGAAARMADQVNVANLFTSSGSVNTGVHRDEPYVTGLSAGEWVRYDGIDFGDPGQFDQVDILHIGDPNDFGKSTEGASIQIRLDDANGPLLAELSDLTDGASVDRWRVSRASFASTSGIHSLYVTTAGANGANLALGSIRLLKQAPPTTDLLTFNVRSDGAQDFSAQIGSEDWGLGYDEVTFTTGPAATTAEVEFVNHGRLNAYLDRVFLIDGHATRGGAPRDISIGQAAERSLDAATTASASGVVDGTPDNETLTGDHANSWIQVDLGRMERIHGIRLTPPTGQLDRLSNFRVSIFDDDPNIGGVEVWGQDYLTDGRSLGANETLALLATELGSDGRSELGKAAGRYVRVQLLGQNNFGDDRLALGELQVLGFDEANLALSDGTASQSSTAGGLAALGAIDGDDASHSETQANDVDSWWQVRFPQAFSIGEVELVNRENDEAGELSNFTVSVWDEDPEAGGGKLWEKAYFSSGSVGSGQSLVIDGGEIGSDGFTRLATAHRGRVVRVQLNGANNAGNGTLALANVRINSADVNPPQNNAAFDGAATQSGDFYGDAGVSSAGGFATDANDGVILPIANFTSTLSEPGAWWQVDLQQAFEIEQIVVFNRQDAANRLDNFRVSVWDGDPEGGGVELWGKNYNYSSSAPYYSNSAITAGGALLVNGDAETGGTRLDEVTGGRYVRVQLLGANILSLAEVQVWSGQAEPPAPGDFNGDGKINELDVAQWQGDFGANADSDADIDGRSGGSDFLAWQAGYQPTVVTTTTLIDAVIGNGQFAMDNVADAASVGGGSEPLTVQVDRDRALRGTSGVNRGVAFDGWEVRRVAYSGANPALGVDGLYGFAPDAGVGSGQTGQAFVNSGAASVVADTINHAFNLGDVVDLSYLQGSDTGGGTGTAYVTASLIFDRGLASEFTHTFAETSGTGFAVNADTSEALQVTLPQDAATVALSFLLEGGDGAPGIRGLLDDVELTVTTSSGAAVAATTAAVGLPDAGSLDEIAGSRATIELVELPKATPESFSTTVEFLGETLTLQLNKHAIFGENTRFLVDNGSGELVEIDPGEDRSYLGRVAEHPKYAVSALLTSEGLRANIIRPGQASITIEPVGASLASAWHNIYVSEESGAHDDNDFADDASPFAASSASSSSNSDSGDSSPDGPAELATLPPSRMIDVLEYEVGVEVGSAALLNNYPGATVQDKVNSAMVEVQKIPGNLDARYLRAAGIKHRLGTVIIRTGVDPFTVTGGNDNAGLAAFRDYWNNLQTNEGMAPTHDLAVYHVRSAPSGLAYVNSVGTSNRYALSASNGPSSWADGTLAHEFGHSWNLGHVPSGTSSSAAFYESRPRSNGNAAGGEDRFISIMHGSGTHNIGRLSTGEADRVLGAKSNKTAFGDAVSPGPVAPYGWVDSAVAFGDPVIIDVIANDHDANNDVLDVQLRDTVSLQGGTISLSNETGPGGRNQIIYTPPVGLNGQDFFHYTVIDETGRTDWGAVYITNEGPVVIDPNQTSFNYDLGAVSSPVQDDWTKISPSTTGDISWSGPVLAVDRGEISGVNDVNRDYITAGSPITLNHKLANGVWSITMNMGDALAARDNMSVKAEGEVIDADIDAPAQTFVYVNANGNSTGAPASFEVQVTDGELNIELGAAVLDSWVWNRLSINFVDDLTPGDVDGMNGVTLDDFEIIRQNFFTSATSRLDGDLTGDGIVDFDDFRQWKQNYNVPPVAAAAGEIPTSNRTRGDEANKRSEIDRVFEDLGSPSHGESKIWSEF